MSTRGLIGFNLLALLVLGCAGRPTVATEEPQSACAAAFDAAAAVDDMHDSVSDLYPAIRACSLAEWRTEFDRHDGVGFVGSADQVLANACLAPEVSSAPLCSQVLE